MLVRAATVTFVRLLYAALVLLAAGCASMSAFRGSDGVAPEFTYHTPATGQEVSGRETLLVSVDYDDEGRGVVPERVWFVVVPPRGELLRFEDDEDFMNRSESNATIMLRAPQSRDLVPGVWTVNVYAEDRVGNLATSTWTFRIAG